MHHQTQLSQFQFLSQPPISQPASPAPIRIKNRAHTYRYLLTIHLSRIMTALQVPLHHLLHPRRTLATSVDILNQCQRTCDIDIDFLRAASTSQGKVLSVLLFALLFMLLLIVGVITHLELLHVEKKKQHILGKSKKELVLPTVPSRTHPLRSGTSMYSSGVRALFE